MLALKTGLSLSRPAAGLSLPAVTPVTLDGTNDYQLRGADLTGAADNARASGLAKFRSSSATNQCLVVGASPGNVLVYLTAAGAINVRMRTAASANIYNVTSSTGLADDFDHTLLWSVDGVAGTGQLYIDGASDEATVTAETTGTIDMTMPDWGIGALATGTWKWNGLLSRVTMWQGVSLDFSNAGVRADAENPAKATSLGNNIIDMYGPAENWNAGTNQGTGGDFTMNGEVT